MTQNNLFSTCGENAAIQSKLVAATFFLRNTDFGITLGAASMFKVSKVRTCSSERNAGSATLEVERVGLTSSSHVLAGPDWLEADKRDLHRQHETHDVESAVSCGKKRDEKREGGGGPDEKANNQNNSTIALLNSSLIPTQGNQPQ